jgi:polysaccharide export outer membrane protein
MTSGQSPAGVTGSANASPGSDKSPPAIRVARLPPGVADGSLAAPSGDYRIGPLDVLDISVFGVPDLTRTVEVTGNGQISFPLIGTVSAAGRTTEGLKAELETRLGAKYLQSPQVDVAVKTSTSQRVTVEGAVKESGIYPLVGETTLIQVIAMAKGLDSSADTHGVLVFRRIGGQKNVAAFDLSAIQKGRSTDPVLQGGDVVVVDQSGLKALWSSVRGNLPVAAMFVPLL